MPLFQPRQMPTLVPGASCLHQPLCTWNFQLNNTWMESPHLTVCHTPPRSIFMLLWVFFACKSLASVLEILIKTWCTAESSIPPRKSRGWGCVFANQPMVTNLDFSLHGLILSSRPANKRLDFFFLFALLIRCIKCIKSPSECTTAHPLACDQNCFIPCQFALPNNKFCRQKNLGNVMWILAWGINSTGNFSFRCWRFPHPQKHCAGSHWPVAPF